MRLFALAAPVLLLLTACTSVLPTPTPVPAGEGRFPVTYEDAPTFTGARDLLQRSGVLEELAADVDDRILVPTDIPIVAMECGESNAYYDPELHRIELCYELVDEFRTSFSAGGEPADEVNRDVLGTVAETYVHELAHALIDVLDLPFTGREEDVADQLASYWLINNTRGGPDLVLSAAESYRLTAQSTAPEDLAFDDPHSLDIQRYTNHLCYLYGSDDERFGYLVDSGELPEDRAANCGDEYDQLVRGWENLLRPFTQR
ncbi:DUF4344 domain-containing metallopeptidase [Saccharopolyspora taberi]|uniref:DUF4344 domain-containing metallopeptidase n=1 Tax=Saccharopolyspora taberi TaxID=60895 RepID=A0ABN3VGK9_9PSEU